MHQSLQLGTRLKRQAFCSSLWLALSSLALAGLSGCGGTEVSGGPDLVRSAQISARITAQNAQLEDVGRNSALFTSEPSGFVSAFAGGQGYAQLRGILPEPRKLVFAGAAGNALQSRVVELREGETLGFLDIALLRLNTVGCIPKTNQGCPGREIGPVFTTGSAQLTLNSGQLERDTGIEPIGDLNVYLTPMNVLEQRYFPGRFESDAGPLEAFGAIHIQAQDNIANPKLRPIPKPLDEKIGADVMQLKEGESVPVQIPASTDAPSTSTLYVYDFSTGYWQAESGLTLDAVTQTYRGTTSRVGYLAAMNPLTQTQTITGCVVDENGDPITTSEVFATGVNYGYQSETRTTESGRFSLSVKSNQAVNLKVKAGPFIENLSLSAGQTNLTDCVVINTQSKIDLQASASWGSSNNFKIGILFPNSSTELLLNPDLGQSDIYSTNDSGGIITQVISEPGLDQLNYYRLMKGRHLISVNRSFENINASITEAGTQLVIGDQTFTPPPGEILQNPNFAIINETPVWLAAEILVGEDCSVQIRSPQSVPSSELGGKSYQPWIRSLSDFRLGQVYTETVDTSTESEINVEYCNFDT